jgi:hypothetical protein
MLHLSVVLTKEAHIAFALLVLMTSLFLYTSAYAETRPNTSTDSRIITTTPITTKNYRPIVPTPLSSNLMPKTQLQQQALLMPRAITKSLNTSTDSRIITTTPITTKNYRPIVPTPLSSNLMPKTQLQQQALLMPRAITKSTIRSASQPYPELTVLVNVDKNPITKGEPEVFHIAIHDPISNNNIGNAQISGIVFDPTRNLIQNKFNGTSNSNGIYSYSWTIPRTVKSQTYQVKVNAFTVDPVLYNLQPGIATFNVKDISSPSSTSSHHHHHHVVSKHDSSSSSSGSRTHHHHHHVISKHDSSSSSGSSSSSRTHHHHHHVVGKQTNSSSSSRTHQGHRSGGGFFHHAFR